MKTSAAVLLLALTIPVIAALGGAFAVYAEYDDSPGGVLIGMVLILGAMALSIRAAMRKA